MNKQLLLRAIKILAKNQELSKKELLTAYYEGAGQPLTKKITQEVFGKWFFFVGAIIVFLGVGILLSDNWDRLSFTTKIASTLAAGSAAYLCGLIFQSDEKYRDISNGFFLISALLLPMGFYVLLDHNGIPGQSNEAHIITSGFLLLLFACSSLALKKPLFIFFMLINATWLFLSFTNFLVEGNPIFENIHFYAYRCLAIGFSYLFIGFYLESFRRNILASFCFVIGVICVLGSILELSDYYPHQNIYWEIVFPFVTLGLLALSVYYRNIIILLLSSIFLIIFIFKITSEYFIDSLGWPLTLVLAGLCIIFLSHLSYKAIQKYWSKRPHPYQSEEIS